jgi:uncharacterized protein (TIGR03546 family)
LAVALFSFAAAWVDPFTHKLGAVMLSAPTLQATYASAFNLPLGPWLGFHNTVVCGSLTAGLYAAYPVYWVTKTISAVIQRRASR